MEKCNLKLQTIMSVNKVLNWNAKAEDFIAFCQSLVDNCRSFGEFESGQTDDEILSDIADGGIDSIAYYACVTEFTQSLNWLAYGEACKALMLCEVKECIDSGMSISEAMNEWDLI